MLALGALLAGYVVKPFATRASEVCCSLDAFWKPGPRKDHRFPYDAEFRHKVYFKQVAASITKQLNCPLQALPARGALSAAQRLLRLLSPSLWEECERREAEVRMIGSLFLSGLFSVGIAIYHLFWTRTVTAVWWLTTSIIVILVLGIAMRILRRAEVNYVYLNLLIAQATQEKTRTASTGGAV
jgi:hypothetical protein